MPTKFSGAGLTSQNLPFGLEFGQLRQVCVIKRKGADVIAAATQSRSSAAFIQGEGGYSATNPDF